MSASYAIERERNLVSISLDEAFESADMLGFARSLLQDPALRPGMDGIIDTSRAPARGFAGTEVRALAELARTADELWKGTKWAFVAPAPLLYGMARMFQMLRGDAECEIRVYRDRAAAERWLGITATRDPTDTAFRSPG